MTRIFPCKNRIFGSVLVRENTGLRKPVFWYILRSVFDNPSFIFYLYLVRILSFMSCKQEYAENYSNCVACTIGQEKIQFPYVFCAL